MARDVEIHEEQVPAENDMGGIVTTVRTALPPNDPDLRKAIEDAGGDPDAKPEEPKPAEPAKKNDDNDGEFDVKTLTPEAQAHFNRMAKERRQEKRKLQSKLDELQDQVNKLSQRQPAEQPKAAEPSGKPVKPKFTDFKNAEEFDAADEKYQEDLADWKYEQKRAEEKREEAAAKQKKEDEAAVERFNAAQKKFIEEHDDYEEVMDQDLNLSSIMFGYIVEEGPWLGYHFAKNPELAEEIRLLPDNQQIRKIERIIAKNETESEAKKPTGKETPPNPKPKKPEPPAPVTPRGGGEPKEKSQMSFKEREALLRKRDPGAFTYDD